MLNMSNELYDFLVMLSTILLPAIAAFYEQIATIWGLPYSDKIPPTIMAIVVLMNSYLNKSSKNYYQKLANSIRVAEGTANEVEDIEHSTGAEDGDTEQG